MEKYDDPATTDAPFAESDPVLVSEDETSFVHQPNVQITPDGWVMVYRTATGRGGGMRLWYALSEDGIHWETTSDEPIWTPEAIPNSRGFWFTALVYHMTPTCTSRDSVAITPAFTSPHMRER
jgi:hypothetical protein